MARMKSGVLAEGSYRPSAEDALALNGSRPQRHRAVAAQHEVSWTPPAWQARFPTKHFDSDHVEMVDPPLRSCGRRTPRCSHDKDWNIRVLEHTQGLRTENIVDYHVAVMRTHCDKAS